MNNSKQSENVEEMDKFLKKENLPKLTEKEIENMNSHINKEIYSIKIFPYKKV